MKHLSKLIMIAVLALSSQSHLLSQDRQFQFFKDGQPIEEYFYLEVLDMNGEPMNALYQGFTTPEGAFFIPDVILQNADIRGQSFRFVVSYSGGGVNTFRSFKYEELTDEVKIFNLRTVNTRKAPNVNFSTMYCNGNQADIYSDNGQYVFEEGDFLLYKYEDSDYRSYTKSLVVGSGLEDNVLYLGNNISFTVLVDNVPVTNLPVSVLTSYRSTIESFFTDQNGEINFVIEPRQDYYLYLSELGLYPFRVEDIDITDTIRAHKQTVKLLKDDEPWGNTPLSLTGEMTSFYQYQNSVTDDKGCLKWHFIEGQKYIFVKNGMSEAFAYQAVDTLEVNMHTVKFNLFVNNRPAPNSTFYIFKRDPTERTISDGAVYSLVNAITDAAGSYSLEMFPNSYAIINSLVISNVEDPQSQKVIHIGEETREVDLHQREITFMVKQGQESYPNWFVYTYLPNGKAGNSVSINSSGIGKYRFNEDGFYQAEVAGTGALKSFQVCPECDTIVSFDVKQAIIEIEADNSVETNFLDDNPLIIRTTGSASDVFIYPDYTDDLKAYYTIPVVNTPETKVYFNAGCAPVDIDFSQDTTRLGLTTFNYEIYTDSVYWTNSSQLYNVKKDGKYLCNGSSSVVFEGDYQANFYSLLGETDMSVQQGQVSRIDAYSVTFKIKDHDQAYENIDIYQGSKHIASTNSDLIDAFLPGDYTAVHLNTGTKIDFTVAPGGEKTFVFDAYITVDLLITERGLYSGEGINIEIQKEDAYGGRGSFYYEYHNIMDTIKGIELPGSGRYFIILRDSDLLTTSVVLSERSNLVEIDYSQLNLKIKDASGVERRLGNVRITDFNNEYREHHYSISHFSNIYILSNKNYWIEVNGGSNNSNVPDHTIHIMDENAPYSYYHRLSYMYTGQEDTLTVTVPYKSVLFVFEEEGGGAIPEGNKNQLSQIQYSYGSNDLYILPALIPGEKVLLDWVKVGANISYAYLSRSGSPYQTIPDTQLPALTDNNKIDSVTLSMIGKNSSIDVFTTLDGEVLPFSYTVTLYLEKERGAGLYYESEKQYLDAADSARFSVGQGSYLVGVNAFRKQTVITESEQNIKLRFDFKSVPIKVKSNMSGSGVVYIYGGDDMMSVNQLARFNEISSAALLPSAKPYKAMLNGEVKEFYLGADGYSDTVVFEHNEVSFNMLLDGRAQYYSTGEKYVLYNKSSFDVAPVNLNFEPNKTSILKLLPSGEYEIMIEGQYESILLKRFTVADDAANEINISLRTVEFNLLNGNGEAYNDDYEVNLTSTFSWRNSTQAVLWEGLNYTFVHELKEEKFTVDERTQQVNLVLPLYAFNLTLKDEASGETIRHTKVICDKEVYSTDLSGRLKIDNLKGEVLILIDHPSYKTFSKVYELTQNLNLTVQLQKKEKVHAVSFVSLYEANKIDAVVGIYKKDENGNYNFLGERLVYSNINTSTAATLLEEGDYIFTNSYSPGKDYFYSITSDTSIVFRMYEVSFSYSTLYNSYEGVNIYDEFKNQVGNTGVPSSMILSTGNYFYVVGNNEQYYPFTVDANSNKHIIIDISTVTFKLLVNGAAPTKSYWISSFTSSASFNYTAGQDEITVQWPTGDYDVSLPDSYMYMRHDFSVSPGENTLVELRYSTLDLDVKNLGSDRIEISKENGYNNELVSDNNAFVSCLLPNGNYTIKREYAFNSYTKEIEVKDEAVRENIYFVNMNFRVLSSSGLPVNGVRLALKYMGQSILNSITNTYLSIPLALGERYEITASYGDETVSQIFTPMDGATIKLVIPTHDVNFHVYSSAAPLENAIINVYDKVSNALLKSLKTDANGTVNMEMMDNTRFAYAVTHPDYAAVSFDTVSSATTMDIRVDMTPAQTTYFKITNADGEKVLSMITLDILQNNSIVNTLNVSPGTVANCPILAGNYTYRASGSGYFANEGAFTAGAQDTVEIVYYKYKLNFKHNDNTPVANIYTSAMDLSYNPIYEEFSDQNGEMNFRFGPGFYYFGSYKDGYNDHMFSVNISNQSVQHTVNYNKVSFELSYGNHPFAGSIDLYGENFYEDIYTNSFGRAELYIANEAFEYTINSTPKYSDNLILNNQDVHLKINLKPEGDLFRKTLVIKNTEGVLQNELYVYIHSEDGLKSVDDKYVDKGGVTYFDLKEGTYTYSISQSDYLFTTNGQFTVQKSDTSDIVLPALHTVRFIAKNEQSERIPLAVSLSNADGESYDFVIGTSGQTSKRLRTGTYSYRAWQEGTQAISETVSITKADTVNIIYSAVKSYPITLNLTALNGSPVPYAVISIYNGQTLVDSLFWDYSTLLDLSEGDYTLNIYAPYCKTFSTTLNISGKTSKSYTLTPYIDNNVVMPFTDTVCNTSGRYLQATNPSSVAFTEFTYEWQYSRDGQNDWAYAGSNGSYLLKDTDKSGYYRRLVSTSFAKDTSAAVKVNMVEISSKDIVGDQEVCYNAQPTLLISKNPFSITNDTYTITWEEREQGADWENITDASSESYQAGALTTSTQYRRTVRTSKGCVAQSNIVNVTVHEDIEEPAYSIPSAQLTLTYPDFTVNVTNENHNASEYSYTWDMGDGSLFVNNNVNFDYTYVSNGNFKVQLTATHLLSQCSKTTSDLTNLVVVCTGKAECAHTAVIAPPSSNTACSGEEITLSANTDPNFTYQWKHNGTLIPGATTQTYKAKQSGNYTVEITKDECASISVPVALTFHAVQTPVITVEGSLDGCGADNYVNLSTQGGFASYIWSTGSTATNINVNQSGVYSVTVTNQNGCTASASVNVGQSTIPTPSIGLVTVIEDHNTIVWEKPDKSGISAYRIYVESNQANVYEPIGMVLVDSLSEFVDRSSDVQSKSYRYRIAAIDTCGRETEQSASHKTMLLNAAKQGQYWKLIWEAYEGVSVSEYRIYRGSTPTSLALLKNTTATEFIDSAAPTGNLYYQIEIQTANVNSSKTLHNTIKSNIRYVGNATLPTVETQGAKNIGYYNATIMGKILNTGREEITERGFYYSTQADFMEGEGTKVLVAGSDTNTFEKDLTSLNDTTTYYYRAFATNIVGTAYGTVKSFTTYSDPSSTKDLVDETNVLIYPNPTTEFVFIKCERNIKQIEVLDMLGKHVLQLGNSSVANKELIRLDLTKQPTGFYFVMILFDDNKFKVEKVYKAN